MILPENTPKVVGRAQGIYALAAKSEAALLMVLNLVSTERKYNGSTLSMLGRDAILFTVREMPIVGGSGVFRFARGYTQARTCMLDTKTKEVVVEYDVCLTLLSHTHVTWPFTVFFVLFLFLGKKYKWLNVLSDNWGPLIL